MTQLYSDSPGHCGNPSFTLTTQISVFQYQHTLIPDNISFYFLEKSIICFYHKNVFILFTMNKTILRIFIQTSKYHRFPLR